MPAPSLPRLIHGCGDVEKVLPEFAGDVFVGRILLRASSSAIASMLRQYMAIQLVPSDCSIWPPVGSGALRSKTPMLSSPRNPPWKTLLPSASLRLTHQVKFSSSLWKTLSEKVAIALAASLAFRSCKRASRPRHARAD